MKQQQKLRNKTLTFLSKNPSSFFKTKELARQLMVDDMTYTAFRKMLQAMAEEGEIRRIKGARYGVYNPPHAPVGILKMRRSGNGTVDIPNGESIFIRRGDTLTAMDGDTVRLESFSTKNGTKEGRVLEVLQRISHTIVGTLKRERSTIYVMPDDPRVHRDIIIPTGKTLRAKNGDKVYVLITQWERESENPLGEVKRILGAPGTQGLDLLSLLYTYDVDIEFSPAAEQEAKHMKLPANEFTRRLDYRKQLTVTIDPEDAKDFDDAMSLETLPDGNVLLGVHIADVSAYVREQSAIDREAFQRGTSIYMPDRCIPMLPTRLSEKLCSLRPGEDRLAYSAFITLSPMGIVKDFSLSESVIRSTQRLTYEEAQEIIDEQKQSKITSMILEMKQVAAIIRKRRIKQGSIDFELDEVEFAFDPFGFISTIKPKLRLESHRIVEEFMLLANQCVTKYCEDLGKTHGTKLPFVYRVHDKPDPEKVQKYKAFLTLLKIPFKGALRPGPKHFQTVLAQVKDTPEERFVGEITLRTMQKAVYDTKNSGHFGLAFRKYTHFTSPIRRYPDLMVHRLLKAYQSIGPAYGRTIQKTLQSACIKSSAMERRAVEIEREAIKIKQLEFMQHKVGEVFKGMISGVIEFGLFIVIDGILAEGLVHIRELKDDFYVYDNSSLTLTGQRFKKSYRLGDKVTVQVVKVNVKERHLDFIMYDEKDTNNNSIHRNRTHHRRKNTQRKQH